MANAPGCGELPGSAVSGTVPEALARQRNSASQHENQKAKEAEEHSHTNNAISWHAGSETTGKCGWGDVERRCLAGYWKTSTRPRPYLRQAIVGRCELSDKVRSMVQCKQRGRQAPRGCCLRGRTGKQLQEPPREKESPEGAKMRPGFRSQKRDAKCRTRTV